VKGGRHAAARWRVLPAMGRLIAAVGLCAVVALLGLTACGGSDDPGGGSIEDGPAEERGSDTRGTERPEGSPDDSRDAPARGGSDDRGSDGGAEGEAGDGDKPKLRPLPPAAQDAVDAEIAKAREVIHALIRGFNERDPSVCSRLFDLRTIEPSARDSYLKRCRQTTARARPQFELVEFEKFRVLLEKRAKHVLVRFVISDAGTKFRHEFRMVRREGRPYRIDMIFAVKQPGG
jgi:hypothetical protein